MYEPHVEYKAFSRFFTSGLGLVNIGFSAFNSRCCRSRCRSRCRPQLTHSQKGSVRFVYRMRCSSSSSSSSRKRKTACVAAAAAAATTTLLFVIYIIMMAHSITDSAPAPFVSFDCFYLSKFHFYLFKWFKEKCVHFLLAVDELAREAIASAYYHRSKNIWAFQ